MIVALREAIAGIPEQVHGARTARDILRRAGSPPGVVENILFTGMGGSGMAAEIAVVCARPPRGIPIALVRGYEMPSWVSSNTLVVGVSHSGDTEETVTVMGDARDRGALLACVTSGGALAAMERDGALVLPVPGGMMPRAAVGSLAATCALLLEHVGVFPGASHDVAAAADHLASRRDEHLLPDAEVVQIADVLADRLPVVMGGGIPGAVAAARWKADLNENAKTQALALALPEANHNDLCAWATRNPGHVPVLLRQSAEHPRVAQRFELIRPVLEQSADHVVDVRAHGPSPFAQLLDLTLTSSFVSLVLADLLGVDPEPIPLIDDLKAGLARSRERPVAA